MGKSSEHVGDEGTVNSHRIGAARKSVRVPTKPSTESVVLTISASCSYEDLRRMPKVNLVETFRQHADELREIDCHSDLEARRCSEHSRRVMLTPSFAVSPLHAFLLTFGSRRSRY